MFVKFFCVVKSSVKAYLYVSYFGLVVHTVLFIEINVEEKGKAFLLWPIYFISDCIITW